MTDLYGARKVESRPTVPTTMAPNIEVAVAIIAFFHIRMPDLPENK